MKVLLLVPKRYSLYHHLKDCFVFQGAETYPIDFLRVVKTWEKQLNTQIFRLPNKFRNRWESYYLKKINVFYLQEYHRVQPDVVFIYNNEMLLPETIQLFKKRSKIGFFLGDNPFYTATNRYFLALLHLADAIFVPDTFWIKQFDKMGMKNLHYFLPGIPNDQFFPRNLSVKTRAKLESEVLYVGMCYPTSWGYKKAKFLNEFTKFDLQIHGNRHWKRWFEFFPELEKHFIQRKKYIPIEKMNDMYNSAKVIPVDGNPGVVHGVHFRLLEALGAGALPLLEWQEDLANIFDTKEGLPAVHSFDEAQEMAAYYLNNEAERKSTAAWMKHKLSSKYSVANNSKRIFKGLELPSVLI